VILPAQRYDEPKNHEKPGALHGVPLPALRRGQTRLQWPEIPSARAFILWKMLGTGWNPGGVVGFDPTKQKNHYWKNSLLMETSSSNGLVEEQRLDPDMDNGGAGMMTLQLMLMQCDDKRIQLLPAWPDDWTADFKLHAPYQTTV